MHSRARVVSLLGFVGAAGLPCGVAGGQVTYSLGAFGAAWTSPSSWSPGGGPPGPADTAILNNFVIPARGTIFGATDAATAFNAVLGSTGRGWLEQSAGTLTVGNRLTLGQTGGLGEYDLSGGASVSAHEIYVGEGGGGIFILGGTSTATTGAMTVAAGPASFYEKRVMQTGSSSVTVSGALEVGKAGPGAYVLRGGTLTTSRLLIAGPGSTGTGSLRLGPTSGSDVAPRMFVSDDVQVGGGTAAGVTGTLTNNGGSVIATGAAAEIFVHVGKGRLIGTGTWDIPVSYVGDAKVRFAQNSLLTAADLTVTPGLSTSDVGAGPAGDDGEVVAHVTSYLLAGSNRTISWSGSSLAEGMDRPLRTCRKVCV